MTVYDGSGYGDPAYPGVTYAQSPALKGADNRQFPGTYHNDLRVDPAIIVVYRTFLEKTGARQTLRSHSACRMASRGYLA